MRFRVVRYRLTDDEQQRASEAFKAIQKMLAERAKCRKPGLPSDYRGRILK